MSLLRDFRLSIDEGNLRPDESGVDAVDRDVSALVFFVRRFFLAGIDETLEQKVHRITCAKKFWMPLHADGEGLVGMLDCFDQPLVVVGCRTQFGRKLPNSLMMHGIHLR